MTWTLRRSWDMTYDAQAIGLTGWKPFFSLASSNSTGASSTWVLDNLRARRLGAVGLRDPSVVIHEDGTPVDFAGKVRFLATCATPGGHSQRDYQSVWELDPADWSVRQVGVLTVARGSGIYLDCAGHLVKNDDGTWRLAVSTSGDRPPGVASVNLRVRHVVTATDLSEGAHAVGGTTELALAMGSASGGTYDRFLMKRGGVWYVAHTIVDPQSFGGQNYYVALSSTTDFSTFLVVGSDPSRPSTEGTRLAVTNGDLWLLAADNSPAEQYVYDGAMN